MEYLWLKEMDHLPFLPLDFDEEGSKHLGVKLERNPKIFLILEGSTPTNRLASR